MAFRLKSVDLGGQHAWYVPEVVRVCSIQSTT